VEISVTSCIYIVLSNIVSWWEKVVILLQAILTVMNLIMKCKMLGDCITFTDATGKISFIRVAVGSSIQISFKSA